MAHWVAWSMLLAIILFIALFLTINFTYPKWRKQKYILVACIFLVGAAILSVGVILLMDLLFISVGFILLFISILGALIGLIIDFFTRQRISYR